MAVLVSGLPLAGLVAGRFGDERVKRPFSLVALHETLERARAGFAPSPRG